MLFVNQISKELLKILSVSLVYMYKLFNVYCIAKSMSPHYCNAEQIKLALYKVYTVKPV